MFQTITSNRVFPLIADALEQSLTPEEETWHTSCVPSLAEQRLLGLSPEKNNKMSIFSYVYIILKSLTDISGVDIAAARSGLTGKI